MYQRIGSYTIYTNSKRGKLPENPSGLVRGRGVDSGTGPNYEILVVASPPPLSNQIHTLAVDDVGVAGSCSECQFYLITVHSLFCIGY